MPSTWVCPGQSPGTLGALGLGIALPGTHTLKTWGEDGTKVVIGVGLIRSVCAVLGGSIFNVAWPFSRLTVV